MNPFTDPNSGKSYSHIDTRTLQVDVTHRFEIDFKDIYGNHMPPWIYIDPPYYITFFDNKGNTIAEARSFQDRLVKKNMFELKIMKSLIPAKGSTGSLDVKLTFNGEIIHIENSPFEGWTVLPAYFDLLKSDYFMYNLKSSYLLNPNMFKRPRCYVGDICSFMFTVRD